MAQKRKADVQYLKPDSSYEVTPPRIITIVGPENSGKTTLVNSLQLHACVIKSEYANGPVTIQSKSEEPITILKCPSDDFRNVVDYIKISDVILLMINAANGFNAYCRDVVKVNQVHGQCQIMGILTFMDRIQSNKRKNVHKTVEDQMSYHCKYSIKVFCICKMDASAYIKADMNGLYKFLCGMKITPSLFKQNHAYVVADSYKVHSENENDLKKTIDIYGYVRGGPELSKNVHVLSYGDIELLHVVRLSGSSSYKKSRSVIGLPGGPFTCGMFVKIRLEVSSEYKQKCERGYPIICGSLLPDEIGYSSMNFEMKRTISTQVGQLCFPVVGTISVGWTCTKGLVYASIVKDDRRVALRIAPPEDEVFVVSQFGHRSLPETKALLYLDNVEDNKTRIAAIGQTLEHEEFTIYQQVSLHGYISEIVDGMAIVTSMFSTVDEVLSHMNEQLKSTSGINGIVREAQVGGSFLAEFESSVAIGDEIVCNTWEPVTLNRHE